MYFLIIKRKFTRIASSYSKVLFFILFLSLPSLVSYAERGSSIRLGETDAQKYQRLLQEANFDLNGVINEINMQLRAAPQSRPKVKLEKIVSSLSGQAKENFIQDLRDYGITENNISGLEWTIIEDDTNSEGLNIQLVNVNPKFDGTTDSVSSDNGNWYLQIYGGVQSTQSMVAMLSGENYSNNQYSGIVGIGVGKTIKKDLFNKGLDLSLGFQTSRYLEFNQSRFNRYTYTVFFSFTKDFVLFGRDAEVTISEGLSYAPGGGTYHEERNLMGRSDGRTSKLLNYIGLEVSTPVCQLKFFSDFCKRNRGHKVGLKLIHRSGVFRQVDAFNNTKGGSNFLTLFYKAPLR